MASKPTLGWISCTHTKKDKDPWWRVDLEAVHVISAVELTVRADCCGFYCGQCPPLTVKVDWEACNSYVPFQEGDSKDVWCPWVGDLIEVMAQTTGVGDLGRQKDGKF